MWYFYGVKWALVHSSGQVNYWNGSWFPGESNGTPLQYSCLENPMDRGAWWAAVHGVAKSRTWLSGFTFTFHFHALEKEMTTYSNVLAWRIQGTGEPGGLPSMGSHRVRHDWSDLAAAAWFPSMQSGWVPEWTAEPRRGVGLETGSLSGTPGHCGKDNRRKAFIPQHSVGLRVEGV